MKLLSTLDFQEGVTDEIALMIVGNKADMDTALRMVSFSTGQKLAHVSSSPSLGISRRLLAITEINSVPMCRKHIACFITGI